MQIVEKGLSKSENDYRSLATNSILAEMKIN